MADRPIEHESVSVAQPLFRGLGLVVPEDARLSGSFTSREGVGIDVDRLGVAPGTQVFIHHNVAYLMPMGGKDITGTVNCQCVKGEGGSCGITSTETTGEDADPALQCFSEGGCERCLMQVSIDPPKLASLTLAALGIEIERDAAVIGDLRREAMLTTGSLRIRDEFDAHFEEADGVAYLVGAGGKTIGTFRCRCSAAGDFGCELVTTTQALVCEQGACAQKCTLVLRVPAPKLTFSAE
jgi:hypothetical protein